MSRADVVLSIYDDLGNPHYGGGGAVVVARIAARLARDHRVTVYAGSYRGSRSQLRDGVRYVFLPVGWAGPRAGQLLFALLLPLVALVHRPGVWVESLTPPFSASLLPVVARCPVVGLVQMLSGADMARRYRLPFPVVERWGLALYRHFVVLNETDGQAVRRANPRARVTLIPNGVDLPPVDPAGYGRGRYALFLGRIEVQQKGLDLLFDALGPQPPLPVVVAGGGPPAQEARLRELVRGAAPDRVRLPGRVDGAVKEALLRDCAFLVVPSRYETFCLSALEAMAHGKPVVHFDLPRLAWIGPGCGIAVPAFDVAALGAALARLAADEPLRARLGRGARARSADFGWDAAAARYAGLVAGLLAGPAGQRRSRLRTAESRARVSPDIRCTSDARSRTAETTAARSSGPIRGLGKICRRICS
ncbi:glycosyltransferase family 4 protein [Pseudonocardia asaccharolytica]|uniref:Glycosyltransferase subfamily 4-like N-terminal domain-containing protein n=1 Tax=Pseudonocardia asaccharolytica DSM 44247 = NBRC 16224 TaxID=1123024 RepID=A0A511CXP3_9PSEU|nr:glycosyltransferase family 4 protein [Pseudonocardia asaccharolytica]GEL17312.1 hypothetical protein PA7_11490 [Pseudonocardia asaccharolytica DSM 44247 = NBRC 16224]